MDKIIIVNGVFYFVSQPNPTQYRMKCCITHGCQKTVQLIEPH